jgi:hypothetical protein
LKAVGYLIGCLCILPLQTVGGQNYAVNTEAGLYGGASYYLGDINSRRQFYAPNLSFGMLVKHNFTPHHCLRANLYYGQLKGNDLDFKNDYQQFRSLSFETSLIEAHVGYEFNFLPYIINREHKTAYTPFLFFGIGYSVIVSSTVKDIEKGHLTIPFGIGYKYKFSPFISAGCEWGFRKTFTDRLDGVSNPGASEGDHLWHNNDWYSFVGIFVTFRIFEESFSCPAYKQPAVYK